MQWTEEKSSSIWNLWTVVVECTLENTSHPTNGLKQVWSARKECVKIVSKVQGRGLVKSGLEMRPSTSVIDTEEGTESPTDF